MNNKELVRGLVGFLIGNKVAFNTPMGQTFLNGVGIALDACGEHETADWVRALDNCLTTEDLAHCLNRVANTDEFNVDPSILPEIVLGDEDSEYLKNYYCG